MKTVRLSPELHQKVKLIAAQQGTTIEEVLAQILDRGLDLQILNLTETEYEQIQQMKDKQNQAAAIIAALNRRQ